MRLIEKILKRIEAIEARLDAINLNPAEAPERVERLMTIKDVCRYLSFSPKYLYKLCYTKKIPFHNPTGRTLFFYKNEIDEWVRSSLKG